MDIPATRRNHGPKRQESTRKPSQILRRDARRQTSQIHHRQKTPSKLQPTRPTKGLMEDSRPTHKRIPHSSKRDRLLPKDPTRPRHARKIVPRPQNRNSKPHSRKLPPLHTPMPQRPPQRRTRILPMRNPDHRLNNVPTHGRRARTRPVRNHIHPRLHAQVPPLPKLEHIPMVRKRRNLYTQKISQSRRTATQERLQKRQPSWWRADTVAATMAGNLQPRQRKRAHRLEL